MKNSQKGQTLIETMAAIFVLIMGITAVVGLAAFSLSNSTNINKQIVGIGLARQGIEAVKNMRDTNWLQQATPTADCFNFKTPLQPTAPCYRNWLSNSDAYDFFPPGVAPFYVLSFTPDDSDDKFPGSTDIKFWHLTPKFGGPFTLYAYPLNSSTKYFYDPTDNGNPSGYYRSIAVSTVNTQAFAKDGVGPVLKVVSRVWWGDKGCPTPSAINYPATGSCRVKLETLLSNWKTN